MKKIIITAFVALAALRAMAQDSAALRAATQDTLLRREDDARFDLIQRADALLIIAVLAGAILMFIRLILDSSLKNKLIERGASDGLVKELLRPVVSDQKTVSIKWACLLAGVGLGLFLVDAFPPLGIRSVAILSLSLALGFIAYFFYLRLTNKP